MKKLAIGTLCFAVIGAFAFTSVSTMEAAEEPAIPAWAKAVNEQLAKRGMKIQLASVEYFTIGQGRSQTRILQQPFRWVPNDARRFAQGDDITYIIDEGLGATASGLTSAQTTAAVERAMRTWDASKAHKKVDLVRRADDGSENTLLDFLVGFPGAAPADPFLADIVLAGWHPRAFFEHIGGPGGGDGILAASGTFVFTDANGVPTDINGDKYIDVAFNEVYFNTTFGDPANPLRAGFPWKIDGASRPDFDVETVALHEAGHSLCIGHFGPPPASAVMNPIYGGLQQEPGPTDLAGMHAIWGRWPK